MSASRARVGAWTAPITPAPGHELAGYAARTSGADGAHDELTCRVVVFGHGDATLVLVVLDLLYVPAALAASVRAGVARELAVPAAGVMVAATHTHCGPVVGLGHDALRAELTRTAVSAAAAAGRSAREAELRHVRFDVAGLVHNRRDPAGPLDDTGTALVAVDAAGETVVSLVNLACHPTVLGPGMTSYSRDFPGALCDTVEAACGGRAVFLQGFAGDVNPLIHDQGAADMRLFGRQLGVRAADAILTAARACLPNRTINLSLDRELPVRLDRRHTTVDVDAVGAGLDEVAVEAKPSVAPERIRQELAAARAAVDEAPTDAARDRVAATAQAWWIEDLLAGRPSYLCVDFPPPEGATLPVQVFTLGGRFHIVALPGEPLTASADLLRRELGEQLLLVGYANGAASYLPELGEFARSGYEVGSTRYAPGTVERLTAAALTLARGDDAR
ncbi:hypothetical protein [Jiangella asiatica]|uniref:Neutral/alkaline non-lysosomal ceramidase N-terminal domain-containing protein n=1 Tax=Jiangella asiatica TaxID=2530372 RepID=A0A4R5D6C6_9ACTN|nr:hypothetical protein [Jiangella asiatica]TDE08127.1 hypothetical protein E1269_18645 [Jiangella asiatica]